MDVLSFDLSPATYLKVAHSLAVASAACYDEMTDAQQQIIDNFPTIIPFATTTSNGRVLANDEVIIVAYRGSINVEDWLDNLDIEQVIADVGLVHRGFLRSVDSTWSVIYDMVNHLDPSGKKLFVTGHSLGAAEATITSRRFYDEKMSPMPLFTYGCPRLYNDQAANTYPLVSYRFVNNRDIVPHVPTSRLLNWHYAHVGVPYWLSDDGKIYNSEPTEITLLMRSGTYALMSKGAMRTELMKSQLFDLISDHHIGHYVEKISALAQGGSSNAG